MRTAGVRDPIRVATLAVVALLLECEHLPEIAALRAEILAMPPPQADAPPSWDSDCWQAGQPYRRPLAEVWVRLRGLAIDDQDAAQILFQGLRMLDLHQQLAWLHR